MLDTTYNGSLLSSFSQHGLLTQNAMEIPDNYIENLGFEKFFKLMVFGQRANCTFPLLVRDKKWLVKLILIALMAIFSLYLIANSVLLYDIHGGKQIVTYRNAFMAMLSLNINIKCFILLNYRNLINTMISIINNDYKVTEKMQQREKEIVLEYADKGVVVCKIWFLLSIATSAMFPLKAFFLMAYYYYNGAFKLVPILELTTPLLETHEEITDYVIKFIWQFLFAIYAATVFMGFEPLGPIFIMHSCGQLELAKHKIMQIYINSDPEVISKKMKEVILILQNVYRFVDNINDIFSVLYEINMKFTIIGVPCAIFQVLESFKHNQLNLEFISFSFGCFMHVFIPCYYSDLLKEKSESVRQAIYACGWECNPDIKHRKTLVFLLTRAAQPPLIRTIFCIICLDAFADICHQAYAIFNLMTVAWS